MLVPEVSSTHLSSRRKFNKNIGWAAVVAQLVERSLLTPEVMGFESSHRQFIHYLYSVNYIVKII